MRATERQAAFALAGVLLIAAAASPLAHAASPKPTTADALETCLQEQAEKEAGSGPTASVDTRRACIFKGAEYCIDRHGGAAEKSCYDEEAAAWDARLNAAYRRIRAKAKPKLFAALQAEQRSWIAFRDALCSRFYDAEGVTGLAQSAERACLAKETARRALMLDDIYEDVARVADEQ